MGRVDGEMWRGDGQEQRESRGRREGEENGGEGKRREWQGDFRGERTRGMSIETL